MLNLARLRRAWHVFWRLREISRNSEHYATEQIDLVLPALPWYLENANEILSRIDETATRLQQALGLTFLRRPVCIIMSPEAAASLLEATGVASKDTVIIQWPEADLPDLIEVAAHELAHLLAWRLGRSQPLFKGEGFACYAMGLLGLSLGPGSLPLHHRVAQRITESAPPRLHELWDFNERSPALHPVFYELAWSFAAFVADRYGQKRYFDFYGSTADNLSDRVEATLGVSLIQLESEWHEYAQSRVRVGRGSRNRSARKP